MPFHLIEVDGKRFVMNLESCLGFGEDEKGQAIAVSITGSQHPLGVQLDKVIVDLEGGEV